MTRNSGRDLHEIRNIEFEIDALGYASASVLFSQGNTKVLANVTLQNGLPPFLKGQGVGWLSAEYAMLPCATHQRTNRESSQPQRNPRSVEISRLIARCLRMSVDLAGLREKTILIDCDVLQADGGTRVACITAASIALEIATKRWFEAKITESNIFIQRIVGVSVGFVGSCLLADLDYLEDSQASADFNFVITKNNCLVEVQGTSEKSALGWEQFDAAKLLAQRSVEKIFDITDKKLLFLNTQSNKNNENILGLVSLKQDQKNNRYQSGSQSTVKDSKQKQSPFSLGNRLSDRLK